MRILALLLLTVCLVSSCEPKKTNRSSSKEAKVVDSDHTSEKALDWHGIYEGVLPCADCEGMKTRLTLRPDHSYSLLVTYLGKEAEPFQYEGSFAWASDGSSLYLNDVTEGPNRYFLGEGFVAQLDLEGQRITGELGERYVLQKVKTPPLAGTRWAIEELMGQPVVVGAEPSQIPTLQFSDDGATVSGNASCNSFHGPVEFKNSKGLKFGNLAATLKACPDMELEGQYFEVLEKADSFHYEGDRLELHRARMAPLAKFRLIPNSDR